MEHVYCSMKRQPDFEDKRQQSPPRLLYYGHFFGKKPFTTLSRQREALAMLDADEQRRLQRVDVLGRRDRGVRNTYHLCVLQVCWSDGLNHAVDRTYTEFFDFRESLVEECERLSDPSQYHLPVIRPLERRRGTQEEAEERFCDCIQSFCQLVIKLPEAIIRSSAVHEFFEPWTTDLVTYVNVDTSFKQLTENGDEGLYHTVLSSHKLILSDFIPWLCEKMDSDNIAEMTNGKDDVSKSNLFDYHRSESQDMSDMNEQLYMAFWEYTKRKSGEISLRKGCVVDVLEKHLSGWWFVYVEESQEEGWAPGSYLLPLQHSPESPSCVSRANSTNGLPWKCKAIKDYSGRSKEDVTYRQGDIVEVISANLDGWWQVRCQGKTGFTPGAYLQRIHNSPCQSGEPLYENAGINHQRSIYVKGSPPPKRSPPQKLFLFPSNGSHDEIIMSHDSGAITSHNHDVDTSCDIEKGKDQRKRHAVSYTQVYFDDTNTKSEGDKVVRRLDSGVKYTEVVVCPKAAPRTKVKQDNGFLFLQEREECREDMKQPEVKTIEGVSASNGNNKADTKTEKVSSEPSSSLHKDVESARDPPHVRAICDYQGHRKTVLSFNKDDEATLISKSPTGWWCVNLRGHCGWVPGNYWQDIETKPPVPTRLSSVQDINKKRSAPLSNYTSEPWFVGKMSRSESEALLETGSDLNFIVRESTNRVGDFTLSVLDEGHVRHFPIKVTPDHKYYVGQYHFSDLRKVVLYYSKQPLFYSQHKRSTVSLGEPRRLCPTSEQPS